MTAADRPSVTDNARAEWPLRCAGTPHPEDAIPPLSEHDYRFDGDDPSVGCARCGERRDALTGDVRAAGRAEATTAGGERGDQGAIGPRLPGASHDRATASTAPTDQRRNTA